MTKIENISAGVFFYATKTNRYLFLLRNDDKNPGNWGIPGGKVEKDETLLEGVERECIEELQFFPKNAKLVPIQKFINHSFTYHTFFCKIEDEFIPVLNEEHCGYCWIDPEHYPKPLHPGLFNTINFDVVQSKLKKLIKKAA
jgi:8-oxo-dGTP pyrophosphatase MutT (NUDIX family)